MTVEKTPLVPPLWCELVASVVVLIPEELEVSLSVAMPYLVMGEIPDSQNRALIPSRKMEEKGLYFLLISSSGKAENKYTLGLLVGSLKSR